MTSVHLCTYSCLYLQTFLAVVFDGTHMAGGYMSIGLKYLSNAHLSSVTF